MTSQDSILDERGENEMKKEKSGVVGVGGVHQPSGQSGLFHTSPYPEIA